MTAQRTLIVFTKAPRLGRVKSRLAADIGRVAAWRFYRHTAAALIRRLAADRRWRIVLAVSPDAADGLPARPPVAACRGQGRGDLGRRMHRAMRRAGPGPVILVGSDIPAIQPAHIWRAFQALGRAEVVFGPAADGGFWLVGLRHPRQVAEFYAGVRWSTDKALADSIARLPAHRGYVLADRLADVDDGADYARLPRRAQRGSALL